METGNICCCRVGREKEEPKIPRGFREGVDALDPLNSGTLGIFYGDSLADFSCSSPS